MSSEVSETVPGVTGLLSHESSVVVSRTWIIISIKIIMILLLLIIIIMNNNDNNNNNNSKKNNNDLNLLPCNLEVVEHVVRAVPAGVGQVPTRGEDLYQLLSRQSPK